MTKINSKQHKSIIPTTSRVSLWSWGKKNLFNTWYNGILTVISVLFLYWLGSNLIYWTFAQAEWQVVLANLRIFFVGRYPTELLWRTWMALAIIIGLTGFSWGVITRSFPLFNAKILIIYGIVAIACVVISPYIGVGSSILLLGMLLFLIVGRILGRQLLPSALNWLGLTWFLTFVGVLGLLRGGLWLESVRIDDFSGLLLTIFIASVSIVLSFPVGVLLALGRQSDLPVIRWLSIAYIEIIRGLPLIGILFMAQVMLPLVLPLGVRPDRVTRAIAGFTIFSSAYLAENVRGGLQSIPPSQIEAAKALGLNPFLSISLIILPQALKAVIPSIVGQFISLFKDTSLLAIVGLIDLLGIAQTVLANPQFIGHYGEVYIFIALIYWICCYSMSLASKKLEKQLGTLHQGG